VIERERERERERGGEREREREGEREREEPLYCMQKDTHDLPVQGSRFVSLN